jgi:uncharacterized protein
MAMAEIAVAEMPAAARDDLEKILQVLKRHGARRVILYGSYARGTATAASDIDLCVEGVPDSDFFRVWAECLMIVKSRFSILDLAGVRGYLRERILGEGRVLYAA